MQDPALKVIYNDKCIDLRNNREPNNKSNNQRPPRHKKPPNCRVTSRNDAKNIGLAPKTIPSLNASSEIFKVKHFCPSSPILPERKQQSKIDCYKNKFTMTKSNLKHKEESKNKTKNCSLKTKDSFAKVLDDLKVQEPPKSTNPVWKDQRLSEKYSLLKIPWTRSRTFPLLTKSTIPSTKPPVDVWDKKTYLYDDGSDVDSTYCERSRVTRTSYNVQRHLGVVINLSAYICAFCVISLIIWVMSGNKFLYKLLIPKPPEDPVKKYLKYAGGGFVHVVTSVFKMIGRLLSIPTQEVYHPLQDFNWPPPHW